MLNLGDLIIINDEPYQIFQIDVNDYRLLGRSTYNRWDGNNLYGVTLSKFIYNLETDIGKVEIKYVPKGDD